MARFSERMGFRPVREALQVDSMDDALRSALWNGVSLAYFGRIHLAYPAIPLPEDGFAYGLFSSLWMHVMSRSIDELPSYWDDLHQKVKDYFFTCSWYEVYDTIEFFATRGPDEGANGGFMSWCNAMLEREMSGYRFVESQLVPITSEEEIAAIEDALKVAGPLQPVRDHLQQALSLLSNRTAPDYRNSIKESISAVEALCKLIAGDPKATLGTALNAIQKSGKVELHSTLKDALHKLYGYTSDADGIRHALKDAATVDYEDAMFMLTTCSGYVSYLLAKAQKADITL